MTDVRKVPPEGLRIRERGTLKVAVVVHPTGVATAISPVAQFPGADLQLHAGTVDGISATSEFLHGAHALIVQIEPPNPGDVAELQRIVQTLAPMPVIAAAAELTVADTRRLMRTGVSDVVSLPLASDDVNSALEHVRDLIKKHSGNQVRQGRTVGFFKSAGGVGSTTLATQAGCLAPGMLGGGRQVCLIDFDIQFGSASLHLDLKPALSLADLIAAGARLDESLLRSVTVRHPSGLNVISAPSDLVPLDALNADLALEILELASQAFDLVILDLPAAWTNWSLSLLSRCDAACLVTELNVQSLKQARRQIDLLRATDLSALPLLVVANRIERGWIKTINLTEAEQVIQHKVDFTVANDFRTVSSAIDQGKTLAEIKSGSRVQRDLTAMVTQLLERLGLTAAS